MRYIILNVLTGNFVMNFNQKFILAFQSRELAEDRIAKIYNFRKAVGMDVEPGSLEVIEQQTN